MRYLSVCSGIEACSVAWQHLGWQCAGLSEIEAFPRAVLQERLGAVPVEFDDHRFSPQSNVLPLFGDFTQIQEHHVGPIDLLVGGTPCQAFSIAGKRLGLDDPRGHLTLEFLALAKRLRPRWLLWENVPGVLSDDGGRTMGTFLGLVGQLGYRGCYRVLDAQFTRVAGFERAVPQRRRRVFFVGHLGDDGRAFPVLFEPESLRGHPAPRREAGQIAAPTIAERTRGGGGLGTDFDCDGGLICSDVAPTLNAAFGDKLGLEDQHINGGGDYSLPPVSLCLTAKTQMRSDAETETLIPTIGGVFDVAHSLSAEGFDASDICAVPACGKKRHAGGYCKPHYARHKRHGDPLAGRIAEGEPLAFLTSNISTDHDDCIIWPYALLASGYGSIEYEGKTQRVHRVMCRIVHGHPPREELDAAHSCGVRPCINPRHLRWASRSENMADAVEHGTAPRGELHGAHKLSEDGVRGIADRLDAGETHQAIADSLGVSRNAISDIASGKNWAWLTGRGTPIVPICVHSDAIGRTGEAATPSADADGRVRLRDPGMGVLDDGTTYNLTTGQPHAIAFSSKDYGNDAMADLSPTLRSLGHNGSHANGGVQVAIAIQAGATRENPTSGPDGVGVQEGHTYTLEARAEVQAVAFDMRGREGGAQFEGPHETANIRAASGGSSKSYVAQEWAVRRLTPAECERLQGFPDGWTAVTHRNKPAADGPRYRSIGNSMATNVMSWIGERIAYVDNLAGQPTAEVVRPSDWALGLEGFEASDGELVFADDATIAEAEAKMRELGLEIPA